MLIQRAGTGTLPPPGFTIPPWQALAEQWNAVLPPSTPTVTLGPATVTIGHDDCEGDDFTPGIAGAVDGHAFGWDNESPARVVEVKLIKMEWRPVTNAEFMAFYKSNRQVELPASWVETEEGIQVGRQIITTFSKRLIYFSGTDCVWTSADDNSTTLACAHFLRCTVSICSISGWPSSY